MFSRVLFRIPRGLWILGVVLATPALASPLLAKAPVVTETENETGRITQDLSVLYTFLEGQGEQVENVATSPGPQGGLDLEILRPNSVLWLPEGGLSILEPTVIMSSGSTDSLHSRIVESRALTLEAWVRPASPFQDGPATLVSFSASSKERNVALAQDSASNGNAPTIGAPGVPGRFASWLRTTKSKDDGTPEIGTVGGVTTDLTHVVMTRDAEGRTTLYVNGRVEAEGWQPGSLENWLDGAPLFLANEKDEVTPWLGDLHLVAIYHRALAFSEIRVNFQAGAPEAPDPPPLPYLEISPSASMLVERGESVQLEATWVVPEGSDALPLPEPLVHWRSSDPGRVSVTPSGLATVHMGEGTALVTAVAENAPSHRAGMASFIAGARIQNNVRSFPESLVRSHGVAIEGDSAILTFDVVRNPGTAQIVPGTLAVFGAGLGIVVERVELVPGSFRLVGRPPEIGEVYQDLDVDLDGSSVQVLTDAFTAAQRGTQGEVKSLTPFQNPCHFSLNYGVEPWSRIKLKSKNGKLVLFDVALKLLVDFDAPGQRFSTRLRCFQDLKPRLPVGYVPLWGVASIYAYAYVGAGADLTWDVGRSQVEVEGPAFQVSVLPEGGLFYEDGDKVEFSGQAGQPDVDFTPPSMIGEPSDIAIDYSARAFVELGIRLSVAAGGLPPDPMGSTDALELGKVSALVLQLSGGGSGRLPLALAYGFDDERYVNPTAESFVALDFFVVKEAELGTLTGILFDVLGIPRPAIEFDPVPLLEVRHTLQSPRLASSENPVYVDGGIHYPSNTAFTVDGRIDENEPSIYGDPELQIWRRRAAAGKKFELFSPVNPTYWAPSLDEVGEWEYRAVKRHNTLFGNWVSPTIPVQVLPTSQVRLSPVDPELVLPLGTTRSLELTAFNDGGSIQTYILEVPENPFWFDLHPLGPFVIHPNATKTHTVAVDCTSNTRVEPRWVDLILRLANDPTPYPHRVWAGCRSLDLEPADIELKDYVQDPVRWMTRHTTLTNHADVAIDWQLELGESLPFAVDPPIGTLAAGASEEIELRYACRSAGETTYDVALIAPESGDRVPFTVTTECLDQGGTTWGDPHLISHDGLVFDFHGKGEFVLTRDPSRDFEVQVRQEGAGRIAFNTAAAFGVGGDRVTFYLQPPLGLGGLNVNGQATPIADGASVPLPGGGEVARTGSTYKVSWPGQTSYAQITHRSSYYSLFVHSDAAYAGTLEGLLGDADGEDWNDIALRDGTLITAPPSFEALYDCATGRCFAYDDPDGWLIRSASSGSGESLFEYSPGEGPETFAPPQGTMDPASPVDLSTEDPALVAWAQALCTAAGIVDADLLRACIVDIVLSGDVAMGLEAGGQPVPPNAVGVEVCDGVDNDRDGLIDTTDGSDDLCQCGDRSDALGRVFSLCKTAVSWPEARAACLARGQDLMTTDTVEKHVWLQSWVTSPGHSADPWIGLSDRIIEGAWTWADGSAYAWLAWGQGQPSGGVEDCVQHVRGDSSWNDLACTARQAFVCGPAS